MRPIFAFSSALAAGFVLFALLWTGATGPAPGLVLDQAYLMSEAERSRLGEYHDFLLADHDIDYRVLTAGGVGDIDAFAAERFEALAAGGRSRTGRGLLLVVDPTQDLVRLEVGYALEGAFPDAFVAYVEQRQMVPFFQAGRVADGILAATELIVTRAQRAAREAGFEGEAWSSGSGGAGATAPARLGAGPDPRRPTGPGAAPGRTPGETLGAYFEAMDRRNGDPDLAIYTAETRAMLRRWVITPAQMDTVVRTYRTCRPEPVRYDGAQGLAVIRYPPDARACAPWFFRRGPEGWLLDLTMMQRAIRFGRSNAWHFDLAARHPYRFAFQDWRFDRHGFPHGGR